MLFNKEAVNKVGLMPEIYFLYYEEIDWSTHFRKAGYKLTYNPIQTIYHKESQSTEIGSPLQHYYLTRNRLLYAYRNLAGIKRILSILYQTFIASSKNTFFYLLKGKPNISMAIIKGVCAFYLLNKHYK